VNDLNSIFDVIFQNDNFIVINKKNGISTQENKQHSESIEKDLRNFGKPFSLLQRSGIVHRLDKDTTGLLLIAKNTEYFEFLTNLFKERKIEKTYISLHEGKPQSNKGEISFFLKPKFSKNNRVKMQVDSSEGKLIKLYFETIETKKEFTLIKVNPITGRTHQIRLAFQAINFPIYNDHLYNKKTAFDKDSVGQYLHAYSLNFSDKKEKFNFVAKFPFYFVEKLKELNFSCF
jgi:23S rRNA pseudouridine1911/1915/1917 synthase